LAELDYNASKSTSYSEEEKVTFRNTALERLKKAFAINKRHPTVAAQFADVFFDRRDFQKVLFCFSLLFFNI